MKGTRQFIVFLVAFGFALFAWQWRDDTPTKPNPPKEEAGESTLKALDKRPSEAVTIDGLRSKFRRESPDVFVSATRLSLDVSGQLLQDVANEIFRHSGVTIAMGDGMPNPPVAMEFRDLPLEQGLRRLFEEYDTFFYYSRIDGMPAQLTTVWVYPPGQGQKLAPLPSLREVQSDERAQDMDDPDALKRALAIATLAERHGNAAVEVVKTGLVDFDERVRIEALQTALHTPVDVPTETLKEMVQSDPSELVRSIALAGLVNRAEAGLIERTAVWEVLDIARSDIDPVVSELAARIAESWDEAAAESAGSTSQDQAVDPQLDAWMSQEDSDPQ